MEPTIIDTLLGLVDLQPVVDWLPTIGGSILLLAIGFAVIKLGKRGISRA